MSPEQKKIANQFLLESVQSCDMQRFLLCLQKGGDIKMREPGTNRTLLMVAILRHPGSPSLAQAIIDKGCDLLAADSSGKNAFDHASGLQDYERRRKMTDLLLKALPDARSAETAPKPANDFNDKFNDKALPQTTERVLPSVKPISFDEENGGAPAQTPDKSFKL